jgi:hypothetical protein
MFGREEPVEEASGGIDVGAFVEHDAVGARGGGGIGDFRAGREPLAGEGFEDLGGPNDGDVGGLGEAEDGFLVEGEVFPADFDGEVAAGDHDSEGRMAKAFEQDGNERARGGTRFDFGDDAATGEAPRSELG